MKIATLEQLGAVKASKDSYQVFDEIFDFAERLLNISQNYIKLYFPPNFGYYTIGMELEVYESLFASANNIESVYSQLGFDAPVRNEDSRIFLQENNIVFLNYKFWSLGLFNLGLSNSVLESGSVIYKEGREYFISNIYSNDKVDTYFDDIQIFRRVMQDINYPFNAQGNSDFFLYGRVSAIGRTISQWFLVLPASKANFVNPALWQSRIVDNQEVGFSEFKLEVPMINDNGQVELLEKTSCYMKGLSRDQFPYLYEYRNTANVRHDYIIDDIAYYGYDTKSGNQYKPIAFKSGDIEYDTISYLASGLQQVDATSDAINNFVNNVIKLNRIPAFNWYTINRLNEIRFRWWDTGYYILDLDGDDWGSRPEQFYLMFEAAILHSIIWEIWYGTWCFLDNVDIDDAENFYYAIDLFLGSDPTSNDFPMRINVDWTTNTGILSINLGFKTGQQKIKNINVDFNQENAFSTELGNCQWALYYLYNIIKSNEYPTTQEYANLNTQQHAQPFRDCGEVAPMPAPTPIPPPVPPVPVPSSLSFADRIAETIGIVSYPYSECGYGYFRDNNGRKYSYFLLNDTEVDTTPQYWDTNGFEPTCEEQVPTETERDTSIGNLLQREWFILLLIALFLWLIIRERR